MRHTLAILVTAILAAGQSGVGLAQQKPPAAGQKPDHMEHRFDNPERYAKSFDDPARDAWQMPDRVIAELALKSGGAVADIGAGTGYFTVRLARSAASPTVYAVDIEPAMVKHLASRAAAEHLKNVVAVQAGPDRPNLPAAVDVILIVNTYHHLPNRPAYFDALKKSLKPGGRIAIVDYHKDAPDGPPREFRFTAEEIQAEMKRAGYALDAKHDFLPRQTFQVFRPQASAAAPPQ
jgi:SAM-dependent methyltransferase